MTVNVKSRLAGIAADAASGISSTDNMLKEKDGYTPTEREALQLLSQALTVAKVTAETLVTTMKIAGK